MELMNFGGLRTWREINNEDVSSFSLVCRRLLLFNIAIFKLADFDSEY